MAYPPHIQNLSDNIAEVGQLIQIHKKIAGVKPGRKSNVQTLNKSAIVLLTACWEAFIEDLLSASFDFLIDNSINHTTIPSPVLTKASNDLKNSSDNRKVWDLAGDGWKNVLKMYKGQILKKEIDYFHVPRPNNIDDIFEKLIGLSSVTSHWKWKKMSNVSAKKNLNSFIDLRGSIAHKLKATKTIRKTDVVYYLHFINCIGVILHNTTTDFLNQQLGKAPWVRYTYKTIS